MPNVVSRLVSETSARCAIRKNLSRSIACHIVHTWNLSFFSIVYMASNLIDVLLLKQFRTASMAPFVNYCTSVGLQVGGLVHLCRTKEINQQRNLFS